MVTCGENVTTILRGKHKNSTLSKWRVSNYGRAHSSHNWAICILRTALAGRQKPQYVSGLPTCVRYFYYWHFGSLNAVYWKPEKMFRKLQKIWSHSAFFLTYWGYPNAEMFFSYVQLMYSNIRKMKPFILCKPTQLARPWIGRFVTHAKD